MNVNSTSMTVSDYCQAMERHEIIVNKQYQRSDKVWPEAARSYLIESLILGFPLPKFTLFMVTDLPSKKTFKEIVDGQQRSIAIVGYYDDSFAISNNVDTIELKGKRFSELSEEYQGAFITATLSIDQLVAASREDIREAFRRMNSYTIPLNPEESRHAEFQGQFKWFIHRIADRYNAAFVRMGLFSEKQIVRMADTKLLAEVCEALFIGIRTTNKKILDKLYRGRDSEFPEEEITREWVKGALDLLQSWDYVSGGPLMKHYIIYSLILAIIHIRYSVGLLEAVFPSPRLGDVGNDLVVRNLLELADALESGDERGVYSEFVKACTSRTNVKDQRETRFIWLCRALSQRI